MSTLRWKAHSVEYTTLWISSHLFIRSAYFAKKTGRSLNGIFGRVGRIASYCTACKI